MEGYSQLENNNKYKEIILSNMIRNGELVIPDKEVKDSYLLKDEEYDKKVSEINESHLHEDIPQEDFIIYSLPKFQSIKLTFPLLVSMKIDGACICLQFISDNEGINLKKVYTKNYASLKSQKSLDNLLVKFKNLSDIDLIKNKLTLMGIDFKEIIVRVELYGVECGDVGPANYASAAISCDVENFSNYKLQMKVVEVPYIRMNQKVPIQQLRVFEIFGELSVPHRIVTSEIEFKEALLEYTTQSEIPCDGIVYSKESWTYPIASDMSKTVPNKSVNYEKYAMKTYDSVNVEVVDNPVFCSSIDGQISCSIIFSPVTVKNKKYTKSRFPLSKFGEIGKGSKLELEFSSGSFPQIKEVLTSSESPFAKPVKCMYCSQELSASKDGAIYCTNANCPEVHILLMCKLVSNFMKGIGEATIRKTKGPIITLENLISHISSSKNYDKQFISKVLDTNLILLIKLLGYLSESMFTKLSTEAIIINNEQLYFSSITIRKAIELYDKSPERILEMIETKTQNSRVKRNPAKRLFILNVLRSLTTNS